MAKRVTRKHFETFNADLTKALEALRAAEAQIDALFDNPMILQNRALLDDLGRISNAMHDQVTAAEGLAKDADRAWRRRNWTGANYALASLVAQNID